MGLKTHYAIYPLKMKINIISTKFIKPQTPTPQNLKTYKISFIDQFTGSFNIAVILFYESRPQNELIRFFKQSLSETLVQFYPLAGRYIKNHHIVDCNDDGAELVEAEAPDVELIALLPKIETEQLNALIPEPYFRTDEASGDPLLAIQITRFSCGGLALAVSVSHRVFDMSSLGTFVAAWSNAANPDQTAGIGKFSPTFSVPTLLPYKDLDGVASSRSGADDDVEFVVKRLLFDKADITSLRSEMELKSGETLSRVRVVCAVIAKALIRLEREKRGKIRDSVVCQVVSMRGRTVAPQPRHVCGNFFVIAVTRRVAGDGEIEIRELVGLIGDSIVESIGDCAQILSSDCDGRDIIMNNFGKITREVYDGTNIIAFTDWSKFGFYEADFGFGKPLWTGIGPQRQALSACVLMGDKKGGGIEAWLHLNQNDMRCFEEDEDIKKYII